MATETDREEFDYIVVGAGAAGCVLAARLSEDTHNRVLLIERGEDRKSLWIDVPAGMFDAMRKFSVAIETEPQASLGGRRLTQFQGNVLGGGGAVNGMIYLRGHPADYDGWAAGGATGWSYEDVLPYFLRSEAHAWKNGAFHNDSGPLGVTAPREATLSRVQRAFLEAGGSLGYPIGVDLNGNRPEGFGVFDRATRRGRRESTARAFLGPALRRPNLQVLTGTRVDRVLIRRNSAVGVRVTADGISRAIHGAQTILAAGAYVSPQLLMLSGIGPAKHLQDHGIQVAAARDGVGGNLQNHFDSVMLFESERGLSLRRATVFPGRLMAGLRWFATGTGAAASNHLEIGAYVRSNPALPRPDLQLMLVNVSLKPGTSTAIDKDAFSIHVNLELPRSRGAVTLASPDPSAAPSIDLNALGAAEDLDAMVSGALLARRIVGTPAFSAIVRGEMRPGAETADREALAAFIRGSVFALYHPAGTCRMGSANDPLAVVDPRLRVIGVEGLRIADASVMPSVPAANTYAPTIMLAEKAAAMIAEDTKRPR